MEANTQADQVIRYVYVHVPFCLRKCSYCSFYSIELSSESLNVYVSYLQREINKFIQKFKIKPKTIYFGGGTPSLLTAKQINAIISKFDTSETEEITLECNPVNMDRKFVKELTSTKVNRISLGAQSFLNSELKLLGRIHKAKAIYTGYKLLRDNGYKNISLDLIYGLPAQTDKDVEISLNKIIKLKPEHISTYCLSLEDDVPLFASKSKIPEDKKLSEFYYLIRNRLISAGYDHYEISNFARSNYSSKHNLCYWNDEYYLGFGPSAAGYVGSIRYNNPADVEEYYSMLDENKLMSDRTILNINDHEREYIFLGLRKASGINLIEFKNKFNADFLIKYKRVIHKYNNLLEVNDNTIKLKHKAYFISNEIFSEFM